MGFMTIDGRKVEFTDEKTYFLSLEKPVLIYLHFAIILSCPPLAHVVYVP